MMAVLLIVVGGVSFVVGCWFIAQENVKQRRREIRRQQLRLRLLLGA